MKDWVNSGPSSRSNTKLSSHTYLWKLFYIHQLLLIKLYLYRQVHVVLQHAFSVRPHLCLFLFSLLIFLFVSDRTLVLDVLSVNLIVQWSSQLNVLNASYSQQQQQCDC